MANSNKIHPRMIEELGTAGFIYLFSIPEGENRQQNGFVCVCMCFCLSVLVLRELLKMSVSIPNKDSGVNSLVINLYLKMCRRETVRQPV